MFIFGNILQDWGFDVKISLLKRAYNALPDNGVLIVMEYFIDNERKQNTESITMSLNMGLEKVAGYSFTPHELEGWVKDAGFTKEIKYIPLRYPATAAIIHK